MYVMGTGYTPSGRLIVVAKELESRAPPITILTVSIQNDGSWKASTYNTFDEVTLVSHLRAIGLAKPFKDAAGYAGEVAAYAMYKELMRKQMPDWAADFETFEGERKAAEGPPLTAFDPLIVPMEFPSSAEDYCAVIDGKIACAKDMFDKGRYEESQETLAQIISSLRRYSKNDLADLQTDGKMRGPYSPFDGLDPETHRHVE